MVDLQYYGGLSCEMIGPAALVTIEAGTDVGTCGVCTNLVCDAESFYTDPPGSMAGVRWMRVNPLLEEGLQRSDKPSDRMTERFEDLLPY